MTIDFKYSTHQSYHCYIAIINKCNEIPAYMLLAKHISLIMLSKNQKNPCLQFLASDTNAHMSNEQYIWAKLPLPNIPA